MFGITAGGGPAVPIGHADRFFIGGEWVAPSSDATIDVIDPATEELVLHGRRGAGRRHGTARSRPPGTRSTRVRGRG